MRIEIESFEALEDHLLRHGHLDEVVCQGLDLSAHGDRLRTLSLRDAVFLGCNLDAETQARVTAHDGLVFPRLPDLPYRPYRPALYTLEELMQGWRRGTLDSFHADARDSKIYRHAQGFRHALTPPIVEALAQRLHDHAIDNALSALLEGKEVAAIMGGHALTRDQPLYRAVAEIGRGLSRRGLFVATGGGPGAMEAGNLGAWLAPYPDEALDDALDLLAPETSYRQADAYLDCGQQVRDRYPDGGDSLAIPTWFYGHEPTNQFARHIAKYFANSLREDGLLAIAKRGVVFAPGSAGTLQEVFMDACQNHYGVFDVISPMVFLGTSHWRDTIPAVPLLEKLAGDRPYARLLHVADDPHTIVDLLVTNEPIPS